LRGGVKKVINIVQTLHLLVWFICGRLNKVRGGEV